MTATLAKTVTVRLGAFECDISIPPLTDGVAHAVIEWTPHVPDFDRDLTAAQRLEYRLALITAVSQARREE